MKNREVKKEIKKQLEKYPKSNHVRNHPKWKQSKPGSANLFYKVPDSNYFGISQSFATTQFCFGQGKVAQKRCNQISMSMFQ